MQMFPNKAIIKLILFMQWNIRSLRGFQRMMICKLIILLNIASTAGRSINYCFLGEPGTWNNTY